MALNLQADMLNIFSIKDYATTVNVPTSDLLLESGNFLLFENGGKVLLSSSAASLSFNAIFDNQTVPVELPGSVVAHQEQPMLTCRTIDVSDIVENDTYEINSVEYIAKSWMDNGVGVTEIRLEKVI
tara:strand:- start:3610 stop:3990 length:381 start_codon:yes stop_codon:yes gene_type:complete